MKNRRDLAVQFTRLAQLQAELDLVKAELRRDSEVSLSAVATVSHASNGEFSEVSNDAAFSLARGVRGSVWVYVLRHRTKG